MRSYLAPVVLSVVAAATAVGSVGCFKGSCGSANPFAADSAGPGAPAPSENAGTAAPQSADRAISEADIIQLDGDRLYAMSKSGSVAIVDVTNPAALSLLGKANLSGEPFEMYRKGNILLTMSNAAVDSFGVVRPPTPDGQTPTTSDHTNDGSLVTALDVTDPKNPRPITQFVIDGEIADSRLVGDVLYVATYENSACFGCGAKPRTLVTSFDVSDATNPKRIDQVDFESNAPDAYNLAWGMAWKRSIFVNETRLYIGGHADFDPYATIDPTIKEGIVDVLDITDPTGHLVKGARINTPGAVLSRWQMDETDGIFRVISQPGAGRTANGTGQPEVDTFTVVSTNEFTPLGTGALTLPRQEGLRTVRFDGKRAYAITFNQTDPLFAIDLSDPAHPQQRGALQMPGWMFYLEPHGDRVIGLGVDRTDPNGSLNVSLFDVSNMDSPKMLQRVAFGATLINEDYEITNYELPEDQDRIQKAFKVFPDGLVAIPYSGVPKGYGASACESQVGGVQLVSWQSDSLSLSGLLTMAGNPRRAFEKGNAMLTVSDSHVSTFALPSASASGTQLSSASDLVIGTCVDRSMPQGGAGGFGGQPQDGVGGYDYAGGGDDVVDSCE